jgi:hypothetical protein
MSWPRRIALLLAVVIPVAVVGALMHRAGQRELAAQEALMEETKRRLAELAPIQKQVEEFQKQKAEYEARIAAIERLRSAPSPMALMKVAAVAESLGLSIEEMSVSGMALNVTFRAPSPEAAERLRAEVEARSLAVQGGIKAGDKGRYTLSATLLPAPPEARLPPPEELASRP